MTNAHCIDEARLGLMLSELRLPTIKSLWPQFAEQADIPVSARAANSFSLTAPALFASCFLTSCAVCFNVFGLTVRP
jgi:hypothetical protein